MKPTDEVRSIAEKERIRSQIDAQVTEFLRNGGQIDVVNSAGTPGRSLKGGAWQEQETFFESAK